MSVLIKKLNESYIKIICEPHLMKQLQEHFTFYADNYKFMPKFKDGSWDGKIRLLNYKGEMYYGLWTYVEEFCISNNIEVTYNDDISTLEEISESQILKYIKSLDLCSKGNPIEVRDYQVEAILHSLRHKRAVLLSATSCHKKGDLVLCYDGTYKKIEDIKVGDYVIGMDGNKKEVLKTFTGVDELYEIDPKLNRPKITVTGKHLLPIQNSRKYISDIHYDDNNIHYISVENYIKKSSHYKHVSNIIYNKTEVNFELKPLTINISPYFIGIYLGDGHTRSITITTMDKEILNECLSIANHYNMNIRYHNNGSRADTICLSNKKGSTNKIADEFKQIGLFFNTTKNRTSCDKKHIPQELFNTPISYRYELLAGLIDSDGSLANGTYFELSSKSKQLSEDITKLAISLGMVSYYTEKYNKKYNKMYYRIVIMGDIHKIPTRVPRKQAIQYKRRSNPYRNKFNVRYIGIDEYYGIQVEDSLYITNGGMITHNSGKSLLQYILTRQLLDFKCSRGLLVVPTVSLVHQMWNDFKDYSTNNKWDVESNVHKIYAGQDKLIDKPFTISTYASLLNFTPKQLEKFEFILFDETHCIAGDIFREISLKSSKTRYKLGFTGTLKDAKSNKLIIEGVLGKAKDIIKSHELISNKQATPVEIKCLTLVHPKLTYLSYNFKDYKSEVDYICSNLYRNRFIKNLSLSLKGNTLILCNYVEHCKLLYEEIKNSSVIGDRKVYYISGEITGDERELIRNDINKNKDCIIVATLGTLSTGVNIPSLSNLIFAHPTKAKIKTLQSIGRILRLSEDKSVATVYDISDYIPIYDKNNDVYLDNYTIKHFKERLKIYKNEKFPVSKYKIKLLEK